MYRGPYPARAQRAHTLAARTAELARRTFSVRERAQATHALQAVAAHARQPRSLSCAVRERAPAPRRQRARAYMLGLGCALATTCGCLQRPLLPTLSLHAVLVVRQSDKPERSRTRHDFGLQAQLTFEARRTAHPRAAASTSLLPLPMLPNCEHVALCEWAELSEESALAALGVTP